MCLQIDKFIYKSYLKVTKFNLSSLILVITTTLCFKWVYYMGPSWPWSYGSLIYNYLCNWCCEFQPRLGRGVQYYVIKFVGDLRQVGGFLRVLRFIPPRKLNATISSSSFGIQLSIHWMTTSCCACVGIRNNNKFSQFITYLQVVPIGTNFVVKTIYNFIFI
jgi:hypothetical protein